MKYFEWIRLKNNSNVAINPATEEKQDALSVLAQSSNDMVSLLKRLIKITESLSVVDISQRQRVSVDAAVISSGTVTTVSTLTSATNIVAFGGADAREAVFDAARTAYNTGIRSKLTFS